MNTLIIGFEWGGPLKQSMIDWLYRHGLMRENNYHSIVATPCVCAKNLAVEYALSRANEFDWVMFINNDICPTESTIKFLELDTDLKCCKCKFAGASNAFQEIDTFHTALSLIRIEVFRHVQKPYFQYQYNKDYTSLINCDCQRFANLCMDAGYTVGNAGWCDHRHTGQSLCSPPG